MEALGLPTSFGKPKVSESLPGKPEEPAGTSSRGEPSGRGPRGVVGGGKRARGRGRGGHVARPEVTQEVEQPQVFNGGVKRPHPSSTNHGRVSDNGYGGRQEAIARDGLRGGERGGSRGGSSRGRGDFGGRQNGSRESRPRAEGDAVTGFYMDSFAEDPWKDLLEAREGERKGT